MEKYIINGNILLYSLSNTSHLINLVRKTLSINTKYLIYDDEYKYYYNSFNSKYYEYVFTKTIKNDLIDLVIKKLKQFQNNILNEKRYVIFHNFHFVNSKYYKQFQSLFEKSQKSLIFIFTSNKNNIFLTSFLMTQHVEYQKQEYDKYFQNLIEKDCGNLINDIYKPYECINFQTVRKKLYNLMFAYQDSVIILRCLCDTAMKIKPQQSTNIIQFASTVDAMKIKGNKDIIYLEHFILLLINNDNI